MQLMLDTDASDFGCRLQPIIFVYMHGGKSCACSMRAVATLGLVGPSDCSRMATAALHSGSASLYLRPSNSGFLLCAAIAVHTSHEGLRLET